MHCNLKATQREALPLPPGPLATLQPMLARAQRSRDYFVQSTAPFGRPEVYESGSRKGQQ